MRNDVKHCVARPHLHALLRAISLKRVRRRLREREPGQAAGLAHVRNQEDRGRGGCRPCTGTVPSPYPHSMSLKPVAPLVHVHSASI